MPKTDALYYQSLKTALLRRFELTDDRFKKKFRSCRPEQCETFAHRWIEMSKVPRSFEGLYDLMLRDQFIHICNQDLRLFLKERIPDNLQKMADLADQFKDARNMSAVQGVDKGRNYSQKKPQQPKRTEKPDVKETAGKVNRLVPKSERKCYRCNRFGHITPECKIKPVVGSVSERQSDGKCSSEQSKGKPVCFASTLTCGCSGIVVRKTKVSDQNFVDGKQQMCVLADGSKITVSVAEVFIDTPYLSGRHEVWCMENSVYDLIIENVSDARLPDKPDLNWQVNAVETRQQK